MEEVHTKSSIRKMKLHFQLHIKGTRPLQTMELHELQ